MKGQYHTPSPRLRDHHGKEAEKTVRARGQENKTLSSGNGRTPAVMDS